MRTSILSFLFLYSFSVAVAQDSIRTVALEEVVVTGEVEPQSTRKSVYTLRTISMERLQSQGAVRLQDVLNTELNIRFTQDLALGGANLSMQGLPGQNVKVMIDGVPVIGRQGTGNEVNINQINVNTIERIEIIEGPMSVIYGADALAGVINIITRRSSEGKVDVGIKVHEETAGKEYGLEKGIHNESVNVGYSDRSFYVSGDLSRNNFGGWRGDSTGRELEWHPKKQWLGSGVFGYKNQRTDVYYRLDFLHERIYNPAQFYGNEAIDQNYITRRYMHQVQFKSSLSEKLSYNGALSYTRYGRRIRSIAVNKATGKETLAAANLQEDTKFNGVTIRGTLQYRFSDAISFLPGYDINLESGSGGRLKDGTNSIRDYAFFVAADIRLNSLLSFRPGIRLVKNSIYDAPPVIPSINAKVQLSEKQDLRLSYARGFRSPSIRELYFDFFDASHAIEGNPDLEAELSHSFNASWNARLIEAEGFRYTSAVAGFYNLIDNLIDYGVRPGSNTTTYLNIDKYRSQGVTWTNSFRRKNLEWNIGFAHTGRYNEWYDADNTLRRFNWSPEVSGSLNYTFSKAGLILSGYYKYTGKTPSYVLAEDAQSVILGKISGYHWADVTVQKSFLKYFSLSLGVRNVFNVTRISSTASASGAHTSTGPKPVGYGRSYFAGVSFQLVQ